MVDEGLDEGSNGTSEKRFADEDDEDGVMLIPLTSTTLVDALGRQERQGQDLEQP